MKKKGFTLVELLVVIAILAILATVSVLGYTSFIDKANASNAVTELTQVRELFIAQDITDDYLKISDDELVLTYEKKDVYTAVSGGAVSSGYITADYKISQSGKYYKDDNGSADACGVQVSESGTYYEKSTKEYGYKNLAELVTKMEDDLGEKIASKIIVKKGNADITANIKRVYYNYDGVYAYWDVATGDVETMEELPSDYRQ